MLHCDHAGMAINSALQTRLLQNLIHADAAHGEHEVCAIYNSS